MRSGRGSMALLMVLLAGAGPPLGASGGESEDAALRKEIEGALSFLVGGGSSGSNDMGESLARLVEVARKLAERPAVPPPAREELTAAAAIVRQKSALGPEAEAALRRAYAALNKGQAFKVPAGLAGLPAVLASGKESADQALTALDGHRYADAARDLVGIVLLVVTPVV